MPHAKDPAVEAEIEKLADLDLPELRDRWKVLYGRPAPPSFRSKLLRRALAYKLRVNAYGDLSPAMKKRLRDIADAVRNGNADAVLKIPLLKPGTQLIRRWKGQTLTVTVLEDGFTWEGRIYNSLSALAKAITGTSWSGQKFFGVRQKNSGNKNAAGHRRKKSVSAELPSALEPLDG